MRSVKITLLGNIASLFFILLFIGCTTPVPHDGDFAFENVTVLPMTGEPALGAHTVIIADGSITTIGPTSDIELAPTVTAIDGSGHFLMPALSDMHVHLMDPRYAPLYVANGVTTVRNMWGEPPTLKLRRQIEDNELVGPRIITAGRIVDGAPKIWPPSEEVSDPGTAREIVQRHIDEGYDFIKIYSNLKLPEFEAIAAATRRLNVRFAGHTPSAVGLEQMLKAGPQTIEHLTGWPQAVRRDEIELGTGLYSPQTIDVARRIRSSELSFDDVYDPAKRDAMAELARASGVWNVPTLIVLQQLRLSRRQIEQQRTRPEMAYVDQPTRDFWNPDNDFRKSERTDEELELVQVFQDEAKRQVLALHQAGAPLLIGSDAPNPFVFHGFSVHEELELFVDAGVPIEATLMAATSNVADFFGETGQTGVIIEGASSDLLLLRANPLEDISNTRSIEGVWMRGKWFGRADLDQLLSNAKNAISPIKAE